MKIEEAADNSSDVLSFSPEVPVDPTAAVTKSPSFKGLKPASEASSRAKRGNRRRDTLQEMLLRRELWKMGLRYRKNVETMPGKPDLVFPGARVVVFCDGDFWHG